MKRILLDAHWAFQLGDSGRAAQPGFDDSSWRRVDLPHDFSIEQDRRADHPCGTQGGFFPGGVGWYRKTFEAPTEWRGKTISVEFEGVYKNAETWLNGHYLGRHPFGYTTFAYDLTPYLEYGEAKNCLAVRVDNSAHRNTRWYSGSGIYRHVWLEVAEPVHVERWGVFVTTSEITESAATVRAQITLLNKSDSPPAAVVRCRAVAPDGAQAGELEVRASPAAGARETVAGTFEVKGPRLWSPDDPQLYRLVVEVLDGGVLLDRVETTFGIRSYSFDAEAGFVFNGVPTLMRGGCVHHDCGALGAASIDRAEERKVELLKASGFNAIRCAHNPPSPAFLEACDRLGMFVIDEAFDVWRMPKCPYDFHLDFDDWWQRDLDSMVLRDRNHPSVILWSIGNELPERGLPEGNTLARMLIDRVRELDPTRPVTAGINGWKEWEKTDHVYDALDVCGYNYQRHHYREDHERRPRRVVMATESFPVESLEYWKDVEELPYVVGDFVWTSMDYLGEAGIGRTFFEGEEVPAGWPWNQANCGDIDLCGFKRPQCFYREILWDCGEKLYIAVHPVPPEGREYAVSRWGWPDVQESWNWPGLEGREIRVDVYSAPGEVELFLNGASLGRKPAGVETRLMATFSVPYAPGELKAVAYVDGTAAAERSVRTAGPPVRVVLAPDRSTIRAEATDLSYVTASVVDADGRICPASDTMVYFTLAGPGRLAAVASPDPRSLERYRGNCRSTFRGRCLAVVGPTGSSGEIRLRAQADALATAEVGILVE